MMNDADLMAPPYADEPSLSDDESVRRATCRVLLLGWKASVPNRLLPEFRETFDRIARRLGALPPADRKGAIRSARMAARAARFRKRYRLALAAAGGPDSAEIRQTRPEK